MARWRVNRRTTSECWEWCKTSVAGREVSGLCRFGELSGGTWPESVSSVSMWMRLGEGGAEWTPGWRLGRTQPSVGSAFMYFCNGDLPNGEHYRNKI